MGGSDAPPAPDYVGAAVAQGTANKEAAIASGKLNNPNVINPYGTQNVAWAKEGARAAIPPPAGLTAAQKQAWVADPKHQAFAGTGDSVIPSITQKLSKEQQQLYTKGLLGKNTLLDVGNMLAKAMSPNLGKAIDFKGLAAAPKASDQIRNDVVSAMMGRVKTDTNQQRASKNSELIAAGIRPGTAAYGTAMDQIDRQYNDAGSNAILAGGQAAQQDFNQNMGSRQQAINELMAKRDTPLNEINALLSGAQVSNPFSGNLGYQAGANVGASPIGNAVTNQGQAQQNVYNQKQASQNANLGAGAGLIGSLGGAYMLGPGSK
jgi:hypothetical protein